MLICWMWLLFSYGPLPFVLRKNPDTSPPPRRRWAKAAAGGTPGPKNQNRATTPGETAFCIDLLGPKPRVENTRVEKKTYRWTQCWTYGQTLYDFICMLHKKSRIIMMLNLVAIASQYCFTIHGCYMLLSIWKLIHLSLGFCPSYVIFHKYLLGKGQTMLNLMNKLFNHKHLDMTLPVYPQSFLSVLYKTNVIVTV